MNLSLTDECLLIYTKHGQSAVFDYINHLYADGTLDESVTWQVCEPCECESPIFAGACLVCGTTANPTQQSNKGKGMNENQMPDEAWAQTAQLAEQAGYRDGYKDGHQDGVATEQSRIVRLLQSDIAFEELYYGDGGADEALAGLIELITREEV
jgi:hypothetical protein